MREFTEKELWDFVNRAETIDQIQIACDFLTKLDYLDMDVYCEMMDALVYKEREYHRERAKREYQDMSHRRGSHLPWMGNVTT